MSNLNMNNQAKEIETDSSAVPSVVVTEPSPMVKPVSSGLTNVASAMPFYAGKENVQPQQNGTSGDEKISIEQAIGSAEPGSSSREFSPALDCRECVVPVLQQAEVSQQVEESTIATSEPDQDNFRNGLGTECCPSAGIRCMEIYERLWNMLHSRYAIPFWLLLLSLPLSAGVMGALYMYRCPAAPSMATLIFIIGLSLMAVISLRVCVIIQRTSNEDEWRNMLHTLVLVATFLTAVFFITESVAFWRMESTSDMECDPHFLHYSFWWNCVMSVVIVPLFLFPA